MGSIDRRDTTPQLLNRLRMRQVALLLAIDEHRTLRAATEQLGMSQPAGTKMLHELENTLGLALFDRVGNSLQSNAAGKRVTQYFAHLRGSIEALNRELHDMRQGSLGRLAVGSIMAASPKGLTSTLLALKARWPLLAIDIAIDTSDLLIAQLEQGVLEVVIGRPTTARPDDFPTQFPHRFRPIHDEALALVVGPQHPLLCQKNLDFVALQNYDWILQPPGSPMRAVIEQEFADHRMRLPRGLIETGSMLTSMSLVRNANLITAMPQVVAQEYADHGLIALLPYHIHRSLSPYGSLIRRDRPLSRPAREFLALLHGDEPAGIQV